MRISDWSSDVCSSDLIDAARLLNGPQVNLIVVCDESGKMAGVITKTDIVGRISYCTGCSCTMAASQVMTQEVAFCRPSDWLHDVWSIIKQRNLKRSEEHTSELQSLMRISYAVFCLKT